MIRHVVIKTNFPTLALPDGRIAELLDRDELNRELQRLIVPGVTSETGKQEMLAAYEAHLEKAKAAIPYNAAAEFHKAMTAKR